MKRTGWVPKRGDVVWLSFTPQAGREQAGRRPAVILSPASYNARAGLALACPVTSHIKGYPFEVLLPPNLPIEGAVLSDHIHSVDWNSRQADFICYLSEAAVQEICARVTALLGE